MFWILDVLSVVFILFIGYGGFRKGIVSELIRLAGIVFAVLLSLSNYSFLANRINDLIQINKSLSNFLSFVIIFSTALLISRVVIKMSHYAFISKGNESMNRVLGFTFGLIKGYLIVIIFFWFIALSPLQRWRVYIEENSKLNVIGMKMRTSVVSLFNWEDPVLVGESYIKQLTQP
tara:strand:+ start:1712 stop:2239 length:528 start_codon:yes stop_codon:yes gene_type:complete